MKIPDTPQPPTDDAVALDAALAGLRDAIARERGPLAWLRALPTWARVVVAAVVAAVVAMVPVALRQPERLRERWSVEVAIVAATFVAIFVGVARAALRGMHRAQNRITDAAIAAVGLGAPFVLAGAPPDGAFAPSEGYGTCFFIGTAMTWLVVLALWALARSARVGRATLLFAAAAAALAANLALHLGCAYTSAPHRMVCHASIGASVAVEFVFFAFAVTALRRRA